MFFFFSLVNERNIVAIFDERNFLFVKTMFENGLRPLSFAMDENDIF